MAKELDLFNTSPSNFKRIFHASSNGVRVKLVYKIRTNQSIKSLFSVFIITGRYTSDLITRVMSNVFNPGVQILNNVDFISLNIQ